MKKIVKKILFVLLGIVLVLGSFFFVGRAEKVDDIEWGAVFSQKHSEDLGLDWKENYIAILDDLGIKKLKIVGYWDLFEEKEGSFSFEDLDWQINEAKKRDVSLIVALGMKVPRWPECHLPEWAKGLSKEEQQQKILNMLEVAISRYKDESIIEGWQIENEVFFVFGECPWHDGDFLKEEVDLVKSLDPERYVMVSDSGEFSFWMRAAKVGDKVGVTMYRKVFFSELKSYFKFFIPGVYYNRRAKLVDWFLDKEVICTELQAEPWGPVQIYDLSLEEQNKTMNLEKFKEAISFAKKTGMKEFHLWGAEWWYYVKEFEGNNEIWEEVKNILK
jgi:hypothetical protein